LNRRRSRRKIDSFYPDAGPLRRNLYPKHLEIFAAGAVHRERCFMAANRIGKTEGVGAYETTLHLTGQYPPWWVGRTFKVPISAWVAGKDSKTTREIIQAKLCGPIGALGTGMLPGDSIVATSPKPGVPEAYESCIVSHVSGGKSRVVFKSYDQGRDSFVGTEQDFIWLDEECDRDIYVECLTRTMTTNGLILMTFTPLLGMTDIAKDFLGVQFD
jgi:phage terminase large subunit-like protein